VWLLRIVLIDPAFSPGYPLPTALASCSIGFTPAGETIPI
jgi:hypothetical protein